MAKRFLLLLLTVLISVSYISCGKAADTVVEQPTPTPEATTEDKITEPPAKEEKDEEAVTPEDKAPMSDFKFPAEGTRPFAVMIDNEGTKSLPQGGLDMAQLIYEIIVEGGETRLMPVFWDVDPKMIGPVRSSRHYFLDYALEHDAIYVHFGWSPMAERDISKLKVNNINGVAYGGEIFWDLTKNKGNWQDSYTSMERIKGFTDKVKYRTSTEKGQVFTYNKCDMELVSGQKAEKISIRYSNSYTCGFEYDSEKKVYKRFRKSEPHMERVSGKQLEAKNIIIEGVNNYTIKGDTAGRQEVETAGSGSGWFITCGKTVKIKWSKASRTAPTKYTDENGNPVVLNPGLTWIQVLPLTGKVSME